MSTIQSDEIRHLRLSRFLKGMSEHARLRLKWAFFPGLDLYTRGRYRFLPRFFIEGNVRTLDAGCGNGALAYAAYRRGNEVLGVTIDEMQVEKADAFFSWLGTRPERLRFQVLNLYDLHKLKTKFDQIICAETLEHIRDDKKIVGSFYDLLNEGGVLHLCCPNANHPAHRLGRVDGPEDGGHVRDSYTLQSYQQLLEPLGFRIEKTFGIGSPTLGFLDGSIRAVRNHLGYIAAFPLFLLAYPFILLFDYLNPPSPFSIYVLAKKEKRVPTKALLVSIIDPFRKNSADAPGRGAGPGILRVLALVTDGFGGHGGVAQYNRQFLSSLAVCDMIGQVIVLPRAGTISPGPLPSRVRQLLPAQGRVAYSFAALRAARAHRPIDIVFCGHLYMAPLAAALAKLLRANLWIQVHGIEAWQALSGLHRRSVETAVLVTAVSRYTRRRLLEWVNIDPARVKVLPNTVDPRFQPGPKSDILLARHHAHGKKILMTVGRLASSERYKGHDQVIRVLPRVLSNYPETIYLIVGDGDDRPRLEALSVEFGVPEKVEFVGHIDDEQLPDYFRLADVFVMPSTGEGFGIVFLEAMASGIAVIGGNQDASLDPLADGVLGTAVDPVNNAQLASAICTALRTPPFRVDHASRFGVEAFSEHLYALVRASFTRR